MVIPEMLEGKKSDKKPGLAYLLMRVVASVENVKNHRKEGRKSD